MTLTKANIAEAIRKKLDHNRFQAAVLVDSKCASVLRDKLNGRR